MATKRYRLTTEARESPWTIDGQVSFKLGFDKDGVMCPASRCAKITMPEAYVVSTTNRTAQRYLDAFRIPRAIDNNNDRPAPGPAWEDVTAIVPVANLNLDPYFA